MYVIGYRYGWQTPSQVMDQVMDYVTGYDDKGYVETSGVLADAVQYETLDDAIGAITRHAQHMTVLRHDTSGVRYLVPMRLVERTVVELSAEEVE